MTNAAKVAEIGIQLYGGEWASGVATLTGIRRRTVQRVRAAAIEGEESDQAWGLLVALYDELSPIEDNLVRHLREVVRAGT